MAEITPSLVRFNAGVWSPSLKGRIDLEDYDAALSDMNGFIPIKTGEAQAMTGFLYGETTKTASKLSTLIPFQYSATDSVWLELGDLHMRFVDPSTGTYFGAPTEIVTPYLEAELYDVQYQQINDVVILTHANHHPQQVTRVSDTSWSIADYEVDWPAFLAENLEKGHFITPSVTTGSGTLTATGTGNTPFVTGTSMVGAYWALTQRRGAQSVTKDIQTSFTSANIKVKGDWTFDSFFENPLDVGTDDVTLDRSDDGGVTWFNVFTVTLFAGHNGFDISGTVEEDDVLFRFGIDGSTASSTGALNVTLTTEDTKVSGYCQIDSISSTTVANVTVVSDFDSTDKTDMWREGGWSDHQGYPKAATVFEQRVFFGGTTLKPTAIWATATDDIGNLDFRNTDADDAFFRVIDNSQNSIQWMARKDKVFVGTSGEEFFVSSSNEQEAITPGNVTIKTSGGSGSARIKPVAIDSSLAFVSLNKVQLREMAFDATEGNFNSNIDLTELSNEITTSGIVQITYQQHPNKIIYCVLGSGDLIGIVYDKKNSVSGWFKRETDGAFESIVSTRDGTGTEDPLGVVVRRVVNGSNVRHIERLASPTSTQTDWVFMDSSVQISALGSTAVTGATHLAGKTVAVLNDGAHESDKIVSGTGTFTLDNSSATKVVYGLKYDAEFTTLPIRRSGPSGNSKNSLKSISSLLLGVRESLGGKYGYEILDEEGVTTRTEESVFPGDLSSMVFGSPTAASTRYYTLPVEGGHSREISLRIIRDIPAPLNVTYAIPEVEVSK